MEAISIRPHPIACIMEKKFQASHNILTEDLKPLPQRVSFRLTKKYNEVEMVFMIVNENYVSRFPNMFLALFHCMCFCIVVDGIIDHADSVGNGGRYGMGDLQWMTAGGGIVHSEMFPLVKQDAPNPTRFFQIWLNLPAKNKMVSPSFAMFWANEVPKYKTEDGLAVATIWAGHYYGVTKDTQNNPPPDSWASDAENDVALVHITVQPGGKLTLPEAREKTVNRSLFYIEGAAGVLVDGKAIGAKQSLIMDPTKEGTYTFVVS